MGKEALQGIYHASSDRALLDQVVKCGSCSMVYLNPRPISDLLLSGYAEAEDPIFAAPNEARIQAFGKTLGSVLGWTFATANTLGRGGTPVEPARHAGGRRFAVAAGRLAIGELPGYRVVGGASVGAAMAFLARCAFALLHAPHHDPPVGTRRLPAHRLPPFLAGSAVRIRRAPHRAAPYFPAMGAVADVLENLGLAEIQQTFNMGQTLVVARVG
jgi:hypothetical protein